MGTFSVLDVGHGNCAVLEEDGRAIIVDAALRNTLLDFLEAKGIKQIEAILVSHSDEDHLGGVPSVLLAPGIDVKAVYYNPDSRKATEAWDAFLSACKDARKNKNTQVHTQLTTTVTRTLALGGVTIEVLFPLPEIAGSGVGAVAVTGDAMTGNSMSAVIRMAKDDKGLALLFGDADVAALEGCEAEGAALGADVLVFPHHGGRTTIGNAGDFAARLVAAVQPNMVVFSIGRGAHSTPRPEVVAAIRKVVPKARIACTQLSEHCAAQLPGQEPTHLSPVPARGKPTKACCGGSIVVELGTNGLQLVPIHKNHSDFIEANAPTALCTAKA